MLAILLLLVLAINGGIFAGTILFSAWQTSRFDHLSGMAQKIWSLPFLS